MKREFVFSLLFLLAISLIFAAGGGSGGGESSRNQEKSTCKYNGTIYSPGDSWDAIDGCNKCNCKITDSGNKTFCTSNLCYNDNQASDEIIRKWVDCEEPGTIKERVKCRIKEYRLAEERGEEYRDLSDTPEACRRLNITSSEDCKGLYISLRICYEKTDLDRDACFRRVAGFSQAVINDQPNRDSVRHYLVAVLYNIQERIEYVHDQGIITDDEAADLITQIVDIKHAILNKEATRSEIKRMVNQFKQDYRSAISVEDEA